MSTILRAADHNRATSSVAFNFDDMAAQAKLYLGQVRNEAVKIIAEAQREAAAVRQRTEQEGRRAGFEAVEQIIEKQLATALPAIAKAVEDIHQAKQSWLAAWEANAIHIAAAIARRVIRRELAQQPEIPLALVREALELAAGSPQVRLYMNPADLKALGGRVELLVAAMASLGETQVLGEATIEPGGCRVETRFGTIDQQIDAQLARIEEELQT